MLSLLQTLRKYSRQKFYHLREASNKKGLCGTTEKRLRRSLTETSEMSMPSTKIRPLQTGIKRNSAFSTLDLPAPVLPTIPT
jgi:hypothetical protein